MKKLVLLTLLISFYQIGLYSQPRYSGYVSTSTPAYYTLGPEMPSEAGQKYENINQYPTSSSAMGRPYYSRKHPYYLGGRRRFRAPMMAHEHGEMGQKPEPASEMY